MVEKRDTSILPRNWRKFENSDDNLKVNRKLVGLKIVINTNHASSDRKLGKHTDKYMKIDSVLYIDKSMIDKVTYEKRIMDCSSRCLSIYLSLYTLSSIIYIYITPFKSRYFFIKKTFRNIL